MFSIRRMARLAVASAVLAALGGCRGCERAKVSSGGPAPAVSTSQAPQPLTAASLAPVMSERARPGELPDAIVIQLARDAAPPALVGKESTGSAIELSPPVKGVLWFESASTLTFRAAQPLAFGTTYAVRLLRVETRDGVVPGAPSWTREFTTPAFAFVRAGIERIVSPTRVEVDIVFSGAVRHKAAAPFLSFETGGEQPSEVSVSNTEQPNVIRATVSGAALRAGAPLRVTVKAGVPSAQDPKVLAPAGEADLEMPQGDPFRILRATLAEGATGFYVEVVCDDDAVKGGRRWAWDPEEHDSRQLSARCVLSEDDVRRSVHVSQNVKLSVAPGRFGFRILGDFARGPLEVAIDGGARTQDGGVLSERWEASFSVPARRPQLSFATGGRYLPRSAWKSLPISHLNVSQAQLTVRQVPPENLVFWLSSDDERASERTSDVLLRKTISLHTAAPDRPTTTWVDVASMLPATTKGVLELELEAPGARSTARLLLTGMNLVAKRSSGQKDRWKDPVAVWALDIDSTETLSGVDVTIVRKSGKPLGRCTTSGDKGCRIEPARDDGDDAEAFAIVARKGDDLTYIRYADLKSDVSESDVSGAPFSAEEAYRAALWSDRGVYRPGDVAHVLALVRDREHRAPPAGMPVEVQLVDPRAKVARRIAAKTNEGGLVSVDLPFAAFADTGKYEVHALVAGRKVGSHGLAVEEFVPERMKVGAATERQAYRHGESATIAVDARYLFGGSAENSPVEVTCSVEPALFRPTRDNAQLSYGPRPGRREAKPIALGAAQGTLDAKGRASISCPPATGAFAGPARLVASAAVFEAGSGRSSVAQASAPLHPERFYVGLASGARRGEPGKPIAVKGMVVDWEGAPAPNAVREVRVELVRLEAEYGWWWDEDEGGERFERQLRPVIEGVVDVKVQDGRFALELVPQQRAVAYVVRAKAGQTSTELELQGETSGYDWAGARQRTEQTPRPLKATALKLELPPSVKVGEKAIAKLVVPFRGRALVTVETDRLLSAEWKAVEPGERGLDFSIPAFAPNAYVSVLLVKDPHLESAEAYLPDRAFGVASTKVEPVEFTAPLKLEVPKEVRSNSALTVKLDVGKVEGPTYAVVAAVDEGILQLTRMKSPDPLEVLFARRALGVETYETVGWTLLVPPQGPSRRTGGDGAGAAAGRVQPVKPVALWSGVVAVSKDGKAEVTFPVPQYRGQLRVMAVTAGPVRIGRASVDVTVKDPIVIATTLPRFVIENDVLQIPVFVTNVSGARQDVKVSLTAEPLPVPGLTLPAAGPAPLTFLGNKEGTVRLEDGRSGTLVFQVRASAPIGAAKLRVVARAGNFESREELDVPFVPAGPRERIVKKLEVAAGAVDLKPELTGWVPTSERTTIWLTANPYGESFDHLRSLLHYPYGCVEQTTSSARPLLFVGNLLDHVDPVLTAGGKLEDMVMAGVHRLLSMQTPSGGLAYWPGGTEPYGWGTAYATHFLLDAQKAGYAVPQDRLDEILKWIEGEVGRLERGGVAHDHWDGAQAEPYLHYVLAVAGKGHKARVQKLIDLLPARRTGEALEREYTLKAALFLAGDRRYERELRSPDASAVSDERRNDWTFYSDRRRRGFVLSTFQDLFGSDPGGEALAQRVADALRGHTSGWYTTQELVWGVTGLGKRVAGNAADFKPGRLVADRKPVEARPVRGRTNDRTWALARASEYRTLTLEAGDRGAGRLFAILSTEGVRQKPEVKIGGSGLSITRTFRRLDGSAVDLRNGEVPLAGLLFVEIALRNTTGDRVQNIALVDRIPAGFEIENPRLGRGTAVSWVEEGASWNADFLDVRDDRIALFGALERGETRKVVYAVRAVTSGQFTLPPVEAEAMYDPRVWAREGGGVVKVASTWKDSLL